jgi:RNA polymerase sigma-70 factor, ECF subfamily
MACRDRGSVVTPKRKKTNVPSGKASRSEPVAIIPHEIGDPSEFGSLIEPYRRELHLHCYRLLGSLHDAEDLVQETMLRAWQRFDTFKGNASLRTWLYSIATHACFDVLRQRQSRPQLTLPHASISLPASLEEAPAGSGRIEPYPDLWPTEMTSNPETRSIKREHVSLAFLTTLQLLPPRQRAILILADVLDWQAREIGELLEISASAVHSALYRARATLARQYHTEEREEKQGMSADAATQTLLQRYMHAWETDDVVGLVALLKEDATFTMPPLPWLYRGPAAIRAVLASLHFGPEEQSRWQLYPTGANAHPAFIVYRAENGGPYQAQGIQVVTLDSSRPSRQIADVTTFMDASLVPLFGFSLEVFPQELR